MVVLTREQLEDRLAALHEASLGLVRDLSTEHVLDRVVRMAREQSGAGFAALGVLAEDGGYNPGEEAKIKNFITVGMTPELERSIGALPVGKGLIGALMRERRTMRVKDICTDPRSYGFPPNHPVMHSFLGVPILLGEQLLGLIYLTDKVGSDEFTSSDERIIETLAAYAAVAITNARLYQGLSERDQALSQRNEDLALLNEMAATLSGSLEVEDVLDQTLKRVMDYLEVEAGEIFLSEDGGHTLRLAIHRGEASKAFWTRDRFQVGEGFIGIVAETRKPLVSMELESDLRFLRRAVVDAGFHCIACVPLLARGTVVGVMSVVSCREKHMDVRRINLLASIGNWAGITIENARLHRQARRLAILEERERIGMDLHDGIIQSIYAVGLALDYARATLDEDPKSTRLKIDQAVEGLNNAIRDIRSYILDLRPRQFRGEDLLAGLHKLVEEYRANTRSMASVSGPKNSLIDLPTVNATALFHICQEALANVAKHAHATYVNVNLWTTDDRVMIEITDDGKGFNLHNVSTSLGHGLSNMHARARKVGGDVDITSEPGDGSTILAWVPRYERVNGQSDNQS